MCEGAGVVQDLAVPPALRSPMAREMQYNMYVFWNTSNILLFIVILFLNASIYRLSS